MTIRDEIIINPEKPYFYKLTELFNFLSPYGKDRNIANVITAINNLACSDEDFEELLDIFIKGFSLIDGENHK